MGLETLGRGRVRVLVTGACLAVLVGLTVLGLIAGLPGVVAGLVVVQLAVLVLLAVVAATLRDRLQRLRATVDRQSRALAALQGTAVLRDPVPTRDQLGHPAPLAELPTVVADLRARLVAVYEQQAEACRQQGEREAAVAAIEPALAVAGDDERLARVHQRLVVELDRDAPEAALVAIDRQLRAGNLAQASRVAGRLRQRGQRSPALGRRLVGVRDAEGRADEALALAVGTATDLLGTLAGDRDPPAAPRRLGNGQRVLLSGFFYSGSGAVKDHLRDLDGGLIWPPKGELRIVKSVGGYADLHGRLEAQGTLTAQDLVDHFLHLVGGKVVDAPLGRYDHWRVVDRAARWLEQAGPAAAGYLGVLLEGFVALATAADEDRLDPDGFEGWVQGQVARALDAAATDDGATWVACDQAVTAWRLPLARYLPPSVFVLVHRDPRDQYCEVRDVLAQPGRPGRAGTPEGFAARYRRLEAEVGDAIPRLAASHGHRFLRVAFEAFVCDHDTEAARLAAELGLDAQAVVPAGQRRFDPAVSRRNVGKHRDVLDAEVAAYLATELAAYLSPYVSD